MHRVRSIHLTLPSSGEDMEDPVEFVDTADGTRLEVRRARLRLGDEVKNEKGGRVYRVVSVQATRSGAVFSSRRKLRCKAAPLAVS